MNDVITPAEDDDSVDTEVGTPVAIDEVPDLPENMDEEMLHPTIEEDPEEALKGIRGRRTKKDTYQR